MRRLARLSIVPAAALLLLELCARLFYTPTFSVYDPFAWRIHTPNEEVAIEPRGGAPFVLRFNDLGMRGPDSRASMAPGTVTLVFLGGSTTENAGFDTPETFPEIAGRELGRRLSRPVRVFNAGVSGATSSTTLARLQQQALDLRPSAVVALDGINDLLGGFHTGYRRDGRHLSPPPIAGTRPRSYLLQWLRARRRYALFGGVKPYVPRAVVRRSDYADFAAYQVFARNLRSMVAIAQAQHVPLLLLVQPTAYHDPPEPGDDERFFLRDSLVAAGMPAPDVPSLIAGMRAFDDVVRAIGPAPGLRVVDLEAALPKTREVFSDECHFTREGNRRVAAEIVPALAALVDERSTAP